MSGARNLKVWTALLMAALSLVLLVGVLLAKPAHAETFTVNSTNHPGSGVCDTTECTLEDAINEANTNGVSDTIGFASGLSGEIDLSAETGGFVILNDTPSVDVKIEGPGGGRLAMDGNGVARPFEIQGFTTPTSGANAAIKGLTIKNGVPGPNSAVGGGIFNAGTLRLTNSTVSGNSAGFGGGIYNGDTATLKNTILANSPSGGNCAGGITNGGYNLDSGTSCGFGTAGNSLSDTDLMVSALADNGGPTLTHALLEGSPAKNKGNSFGATTDQRGVARPQGRRPTSAPSRLTPRSPGLALPHPPERASGAAPTSRPPSRRR